jgi:hypothetical protein
MGSNGERGDGCGKLDRKRWYVVVAIPEAVVLPAAVIGKVTPLLLLGGGSELVLLGGAELGLVNELVTELDRLTV